MANDDHQKDGRLRLTILGGFLGAGKSTWLRHQLFAKTYEKPCVVVNELSETAVDDKLLHQSNKLHVLAGGCACCDAQSDMLELLRSICNERTKSEAQNNFGQDDLIFEMSGVANPSNVMAAIQGDPVLARHIRLSEIVVIVDGLNGLEQLEAEALARSQIESADRILITKTDQCEPHYLSELIQTLKHLSPGTDIACTSFGEEVPFPELPSALPRQLAHISDVAKGPLASIQLRVSDDTTSDLEWANLTVWLSAMLHKHGNEMARVKGVVRTPAGRLLLQSVRKLMQPPEVLPEFETDSNRLGARGDNKIVLIGRGLEPEKIERSMRSFLALD